MISAASRARRTLTAFAVVAAFALLSACSDITGTSGGAYVTANGQVTVWPEAERGEPVNLAGTTLDGGSWSMAEANGQPVVVNVWWSNCGPCRIEMPMLEEAAQELKGDVTFVGINTRDNSAANGLSFERSAGVSYPSIYSPDGKALLALERLPRALPSTVVLDAEGRMAAAIAGQLPSKLTLTQLVECIASGDAESQCNVTGKS